MKFVPSATDYEAVQTEAYLFYQKKNPSLSFGTLSRLAAQAAKRWQKQQSPSVASIYDAAEQGIDVGGLPYAVVCETHGTIVGESTLRGARYSQKNPSLFCEGCRGE